MIGDTELFGVLIPDGFNTDGASVPRMFWWFIGPFDYAYAAAIVHDYRCERADGRYIAQLKADREFYRNLLRSGVAKYKALAAYFAVRAFDRRRVYGR